MSQDKTISAGIAPETYNVDSFCASHNISRAFFYQLLKRDQGPRLLRVGRRTLISREAAAEWRARLEAETSARGE